MIQQRRRRCDDSYESKKGQDFIRSARADPHYLRRRFQRLYFRDSFSLDGALLYFFEPAFFKACMYLRCRFVWQTQHRLCVCVLVSLCKMCFTKWSLKYSETRNRAAKERSTNNSMFRCDRCLQNRKDEDEDVLRVSFASSANVCVCVWLFVFGGSKKDSKLAF